MRGRPLLAPLLLAACGATPAPGDPAVAAPLVEETRQIVPGPGMPAEYTAIAGPSNNNLDVVRHAGRVFLATRNAPDHFASPETRLFVFSSDDERAWRFEAVFTLGTDLREPRLLSFKDRLFLYFAKLGADGAKFEPQGMLVSEYEGPGRWSAPRPFYRPDERYIPWRVKVRLGAAWLVVYRDGQRIYDLSGLPMDVELLRSDDGLDWRPVDPARPVVSSGGGSETDFDFDDAGDLYAVIRNEAGDETGWGSKICRAPRDRLADWTCVHDPRKYDSPLVFAHGGAILLVGRRNLTATGHYELEPDLPWSAQETLNNLIQYSRAPKRCALWQIDRRDLAVRHVADVPGQGDTCFPSVIEDPAEPRRRLLYNYSSPLDGPDLSWIDAQRGETRIYRTSLRFD